MGFSHYQSPVCIDGNGCESRQVNPASAKRGLHLPICLQVGDLPLFQLKDEPALFIQGHIVLAVLFQVNPRRSPPAEVGPEKLAEER